ncbi:MAG TPA: LytTR family DNA-binding domain-containing protein [Acidothermaceae bacterium]|nr:LytTR family DNA-binding domain-containing protein [Acidothermaceae bacterium]
MTASASSWSSEPDVAGLRVLVVDDEAPARDDLKFLLHDQPAISIVDVAADATEALRLLQADHYDGVFLDIRMPGLDGLELARLLLRFTDPPIVIFVTAYESHAVAAFQAHARGYLLKPVSADRLADAVAQIAEAHRSRPTAPSTHNDLPSIPVDANGRTWMVERDDVLWIQANGDYVRLHTLQGGAHLVRLPLGLFEERWAEHGFVRIHRSYLIALRHVVEVRTGAAGAAIVRVAGQDLAVSRRHTAELKRRLLRIEHSNK